MVLNSQFILQIEMALPVSVSLNHGYRKAHTFPADSIGELPTLINRSMIVFLTIELCGGYSESCIHFNRITSVCLFPSFVFPSICHLKLGL